jgi:hypothetical protein
MLPLMEFNSPGVEACKLCRRLVDGVISIFYFLLVRIVKGEKYLYLSHGSSRFLAGVRPRSWISAGTVT